MSRHGPLHVSGVGETFAMWRGPSSFTDLHWGELPLYISSFPEFTIGIGDDVRLDVPDECVIVGLLKPSADAWARLDEAATADPLIHDLGVTLNGRRMGWVHAEGDWLMTPIDLRERVNEIVAVEYSVEGDVHSARSIELLRHECWYEFSDMSWDDGHVEFALCTEGAALGRFQEMAALEPPCPPCTAWGDLAMSVPGLLNADVSSLLWRLWRPCREHMEQAATGLVIDAVRWRYSDGAWVPGERTQPARTDALFRPQDFLYRLVDVAPESGLQTLIPAERYWLWRTGHAEFHTAGLVVWDPRDATAHRVDYAIPGWYMTHVRTAHPGEAPAEGFVDEVERWLRRAVE